MSLMLELLWFVWFLSATDKLGQIGEEEEEERSDEIENKEQLISSAGASVKEEEKLYQLARPLPSSCWLWEVWGCSKKHILLFNPNSQIDSGAPLFWASASVHEHTHSVRMEQERRRCRLVSQPRIKTNPVKKCRFSLEESFPIRAIFKPSPIPCLWIDYLTAIGYSIHVTVEQCSTEQ